MLFNRITRILVLYVVSIATAVGCSSQKPAASNNPESQPATPAPQTVANESSSPPSSAKVLKNSIGMTLVLVPAGKFRMGSPAEEPWRNSAEKTHDVTISLPFYMSESEITQKQYADATSKQPSVKIGESPVEETSDFPVQNITWYDAVEFCNKLSALEKLPPYYTMSNVDNVNGVIKNALVAISGGAGYHLPTEAQWEYACRAGTSTPYHFGAQNDGTKANTKGNYPDTDKEGPVPDPIHPVRVKSYQPNAFGLYDMHGNVSEWCWDDYRDDYEALSQIDPVNSTRSNSRVSRGGDFQTHVSVSRSAYRGSWEPGDGSGGIGFRVIRNP